MNLLWQVALGEVAGQDVDTCVDITGNLATAVPPSLVAPTHRLGGRAGRLLEDANHLLTEEFSGHFVLNRRSEERRVGKGCDGTCRDRWWAEHEKINIINA